ncbi:hypothetical protein PAHAL_4G352100 [Panicum hallii]|uniref:DUF834 domain-containing protein n=1 Tax=Panicum hallii TaxID=206008 RepID=A0A2T8JF41_9POAL|nr:hypothetical protein PAHAL_4G352100 [Panicum hallii]
MAIGEPGVGGAPQAAARRRAAAGRGVDDDGEEREIGRASGDPSSPGGVAYVEAEARSLASRRGRPPTAVETRGRGRRKRNGRGGLWTALQEWSCGGSGSCGGRCHTARSLVGWPAGPLGWSLVG